MSDYDALVIATRNGRCELELLPQFGGVCNQLFLTTASHERKSLIAGCYNKQQLQQNPYYRGAALYPFPNRLDAGSYTYRGSAYQFPINEPARNNSLHGFLMQLTPQVTDIREGYDKATVSLKYRCDGSNPAYPFPAEVLMRYDLCSKNGLHLTFSVANLHHDTVPVGIGWHPYFTLHQKVDELRLQLPSVQRIEVNDRMLPTGKKVSYTHFKSPTLIGETLLDDCMQLTSSSAKRACTRLLSAYDESGLEIWQISEDRRNNAPFGGFGYVQIFIPPDRQSIAIEPVSCGINAFNTEQNLIHLGAGERFSAQCGVRLI